MSLRSAVLALVACALLARFAAPASAGTTLPLLPLEMGNHWEYVSPGGTVVQEAISGTRSVLGRTVVAKSYLAGPDAGIENWWMTGPNGEVLLAGFDRSVDSFTIGYEPPITWCTGSPAIGVTWTTHVVAYNMATMLVDSEFDVTLGVFEDASLTVPAGTFPTFGVGWVVQPATPAFASSRALGLDGRTGSAALRPATGMVTDWYSRGIGVVQYSSNELFQLTGYGNPTPTRATTWGMLKQLYR